MGIENLQWQRMVQHFQRPAKVLSLGYPDLLVPYDEMVKHVPDPLEAENADEIRKWHGWSGPVWNTSYIFRKMGWTLTCVDFKKHRGSEIIIDLNTQHKVDVNHHDALIDPGSLEHIFNIGEAWKWALDMLRPGAIIMHFSPVTAVNHGMYSISPGTYPDLYGEENIIEQYLVGGPKEQRIAVEFRKPVRDRVKLEPEIWNFVIARNPGNFAWPIQKKYL